ncbi:ribosome silencing factor [Stieleria varia]|uniref:Ribosomal silencing factor RsfS n=1 Tax=Stieleria varia TaxID=2528005 RepID=A0A5C6AKA3_9BACT|nr:ribosome silencing factor [Stieleria varia]TWT98593.1 Ribosomal silencing factor RsfS [Stieleria varia]
MTEPSSPPPLDSDDSGTPVESRTESPDALKSAASETKSVSSNPMVNPSRSIRPHGIAESKKLAAAAAQVALDNNGQDVVVLDVCHQSAEFDLFVLVTGQSRRQLHAISEQIDDALEKDLGEHRFGIEGYDESRWIVLDYGSVVIHLFDEETREYYDLESLWADGTSIDLADLGITVH